MSDGEYKNPKPTVDILIELEGRPGTLVFIERKNEPRGLALPGGFVDEGEYVADAAVREAKEETGLDVEIIEQFHVYSDPTRDPRKHTVSVLVEMISTLAVAAIMRRIRAGWGALTRA